MRNTLDAYMTGIGGRLVETLDNDGFYEKAERAFRDLFDMARATDELQFAFALAPEFRGLQDPGWSTAADAALAFDDYGDFIGEGSLSRLKARVALAFYCHLAEAAGYYEIPKNMLRIAGSLPFSAWPFDDLVEQHRVTGEIVAPNANRVFRDLVGHAKTLGLDELAEVFRDAFDSGLRNGYAHADYVVWADGIRLPMRNGGLGRVVGWPEFDSVFHRGVNFYHILRHVVDDYLRSYDPPKVIRAELQNEGERDWTICFDPRTECFHVSG